MKLFFKKLLILITICVFLNVIFIGIALKLSNTENNNFLARSENKHNKLENTVSPKIVFIGGSNLVFGQDSCAISEAVDLPVVNMGLHAGLGLRYMVEEIKDDIRSGDYVVIVPEYQQFYGVLNGDSTLAWMIIKGDYRNAKYLTSYKQTLNISSYFTRFVSDMRQNVFLYTVSKFNKSQEISDRSSLEITHNNIYNEEGFNECEDLVSHLNVESTYAIKNQNIFDSTENNLIDKDSIDLVSEFNDFLNNKHAQLIVLFPSIPEDQYLKNKEKIDDVGRELESNNIIVPYPPSYYIMESNYFFDSVYHLNKEGRTKRTLQVSEIMSEVLKTDN